MLRRLPLLCLMLAWCLPSPAPAQAPGRDVRLIVPYAPGGTVDTLARLLAEALGPALKGGAVVVENRSGAGTFIGMQAVAAAAPDGQTLGIASNTTLATSPILPGANPPLDTDRRLLPVVNLIRVPVVLVGPPQAPYTNLAELIAYARANPGVLNIGQSGTGSLTQMLAIRLMHEAGIRLEQIQYRGGTPALLDILAGNSQLYFSLLTESIGYIRDGRLRPLGFASAAPNPALPAVPLLKESLPGFEGDVAYGLVAPAETPLDIINKWNKSLNAAMDRPAFRRRLEALHMLPANGSAADYRAEILADRESWGRVIRATGMRAGE
jgi:tripartite-type tricarboxylate transporter receptor subunit TctC